MLETKLIYNSSPPLTLELYGTKYKHIIPLLVKTPLKNKLKTLVISSSTQAQFLLEEHHGETDGARILLDHEREQFFLSPPC